MNAFLVHGYFVVFAFSVHGYFVVLEHESCFLPIIPKGGKSFIISEGKAVWSVLSLVNTYQRKWFCFHEANLIDHEVQRWTSMQNKAETSIVLRVKYNIAFMF